MDSKNKKSGWSEYYEITKNRPPSKLLVRALEYIENRNKAIDIGGGALKDTKYLLSLGFDVTVIDKDELMAKTAEQLPQTNLRYFVSAFAEFVFPKNQFDIASAMFALPFNPPETFERVIGDIKNSLVTGGIFCGQLFGIHDSWNDREGMTFHTREQAEHLFSNMEVIVFEEEEKDGATANGTPKHWHTFSIIARKK